MGAFYTSLSIRTSDSAAVVEAAKACGILPAYVGSMTGGWVTLYPEQTESQDQSVIKDAGNALSKALGFPVISFLVHDGDLFQYTLHAKGKMVDSYDSWPQYPSTQKKPKGGKAKVLIEHCGLSSAKEAELKEFLSESDDGEYMAEKMAQFLHIRVEQACKGFNQLVDSPEAARFRYLEAPPKVFDANAVPCLVTLTELILSKYQNSTDPNDQERLNTWIPRDRREPKDGYFLSPAQKNDKDILTVTEHFQIFNFGAPSKGIRVTIQCEPGLTFEGSVTRTGKKKDFPLNFHYEDGIATAKLETLEYGDYKSTLEDLGIFYRMTRSAPGPSTVILKISVEPLAAKGESRARLEHHFHFV